MIKVKLISIPQVQEKEIVIKEKCHNINDVLVELTKKSGHDFYNHRENYMFMKNSVLLKPEVNYSVDDTDTVIIMHRICGG